LKLHAARVGFPRDRVVGDDRFTGVVVDEEKLLFHSDRRVLICAVHHSSTDAGKSLKKGDFTAFCTGT
jgi:hypothetical protein